MYSTRRTHVYALIGRILLSIIFLVSASAKVMEWNATMQMMTAKGIPAAGMMLAIATIIEFAGGLAMLLGIYARYSALMVFLYLIPVTFIMHDFWAVAPSQMNIQLVNFLKNLSIMGGLALLAGFGPGRFCLGTEKYLYDDEYTLPTRQDTPITPGRT